MLSDHDQTPSVASVLRYGSLSGLIFLFALVYLGRYGNEQNKQPSHKVQLYEIDQCNEEAILPFRSECCAANELPVLGGIDLVELFHLPDDTSVPALGNPSIAALLPTRVGNFKFIFLNEENRAKFMTNPWQYAPAWGGFCAYELGQPSTNFASSSRKKLGPSVDLSAWAIVQERLYFFGGMEQKFKFLHSLPDAISYGDAHWSNMYGAVYDGHFDTNCFVKQEYFDTLKGHRTEDDFYVDPYEEAEQEVETEDEAIENQEAGEVENSRTEMVGGHKIERDEDGQIVAVDGLPVASSKKGKKFVDQSLYEKYAGENKPWNQAQTYNIPTKQSFFDNHSATIDGQGVITHVDGIPVISNGYNQKASLEIQASENTT